jgi:hypothetical protein
MGRTVIFIAAMLLLLLVMSNRVTPALHCRDGAMAMLECRAIEVQAEAAETSEFVGIVISLDESATNFHLEAKKLGYSPSDSDTPAEDAGKYLHPVVISLCWTSVSFSVRWLFEVEFAFCFLAGTMKVFCNDSLTCFVASPDHDTRAQDAGKYLPLVHSAASQCVFCMSAFQLLFSVGSLKLTLLFFCFMTCPVRVFGNESLPSFEPSLNHDTSAHDAGKCFHPIISSFHCISVRSQLVYWILGNWCRILGS